MTGLLRRVQMRLVAGVMLDSGEAVRAVGGDKKDGLIGSYNPDLDDAYRAFDVVATIN